MKTAKLLNNELKLTAKLFKQRRAADQVIIILRRFVLLNDLSHIVTLHCHLEHC